MSVSRRARLIAAPLVALLLAGGLTACGDEQKSSSDPTGVRAGSGLDSVRISDDFDQEPKLTWKDRVTVDRTESETIVEGDGEKIADGDLVLAQLVLANGVDKKVTLSSFSGQPQVFTVGEALMPAIRTALDGATVGSRVAVAAPPEDAFGEQGNPQLGIGNKDTSVFVLDLLEKLPSEPSGADQEPAAWMPQVKESGGVPSGLDFGGTPKPGKELQVGYLVKGEGKKAKKGDQLYVNYLGQVYGGKQPFDESYSKGQPFGFPLGAGQVVKGWDQGLEGVPVGSRVMLAIPPALGYGKKGNPQGGIKGTDTLYFVVDVLSAQ